MAAAATAPETPAKMGGGASAGVTCRQGVVYVPSWTNTGLGDNAVRGKTIRQFTKNVYGRSLFTKQKNMVLTGPPTFALYDQNNNVDEKLQTRVWNMLNDPKVNIQVAAHRILFGWFFYGPGLFNWVWEKQGNELVLTQLVWLKPPTFDVIPKNGRQVYSSILPGITLDENGDTEFWQDQAGSGNGIKLDPKNIFMTVDEGSEELSGDPLIEPIIPVIEMLDYSWNADMQGVNRYGAPIFFIRIQDPMPASAENGWVSDVDYSQMVISHWGKDNAYTLRENMTIEVPNLNTASISLDTIEALHWVIVDYMSPVSFVSKGGGVISNSGGSELELYLLYIRGIQHRLSKALEEIVQYYLDKNGYKGYHGEIRFPQVSQDQSQLNLDRARFLWDSGLGFPNECREFAGVEGVSDEELAKLPVYREMIGVQVAQPLGLNASMVVPDQVAVSGPTEDDQNESIVPQWLENLAA